MTAKKIIDLYDEEAGVPIPAEPVPRDVAEAPAVAKQAMATWRRANDAPIERVDLPANPDGTIGIDAPGVPDATYVFYDIQGHFQDSRLIAVEPPTQD